MKRLTLVRHAHAKVQAPPVTDFERPLSRRGKTEARATAATLFKEGLVPQLMLSSPAARTLQTARIFARELKTSARLIREDELLYLAAPETILQLIHATGARIEHLMVIGHNPGISALANVLAPQAKLGEFAPAAACTIDVEVHAWTAVTPGSARHAQQRIASPRLFGIFS